MGFSLNLGRVSAYRAELWGAFTGLRIAKELGYNFVILEVNNMSVVDVLKNPTSDLSTNAELVNSIITLLRED